MASRSVLICYILGVSPHDMISSLLFVFVLLFLFWHSCTLRLILVYLGVYINRNKTIFSETFKNRHELQVMKFLIRVAMVNVGG